MMGRRTPARAALLAGLALWLLAALPGPAGALVGDSRAGFGLDGSLRTILGLSDSSALPEAWGDSRDVLSQTLLRLTAAGRPVEWLKYEVHLVQSLTLTPSQTRGAGLADQERDLAYRALDEKWTWLEEDDALAGLWLDRFNLKISLPRIDLTLGRQAVTFGQAYFWNPLDVFLPFDPSQFDRDYKAGVDALRLDLALGQFSGLNLVWAPGRRLTAGGRFADDEGVLDASWSGSALLARLFTNLSGWDLSFLAGKVYGGWQVGAGATGEIGWLEVRAEAAWLEARDGQPLPPPLEGDLVEDHLTAVLGLGHRFDNSLTLEAEYLYNGAGDPDHLEAAMIRTADGFSLHWGRHLVGLMVSYELSPLTLGRAVFIQSLSDGSAQVQPGLTVSLSDNSELLLGVTWNLGRPPREEAGLVEPRSEFGSAPHFYYLEVKVYF